jgi:hypothetical protein
MIMDPWTITLQATPKGALLLVTSAGSDLLKARLPLKPSHPRALLTLLEGLALWRGQALHVAISADADSPAWAGSALFGDELFPAESPLVQFHAVHRGCRVRLRGVADFRSLRRIET